jgi:hypothetical protein
MKYITDLRFWILLGMAIVGIMGIAYKIKPW